MMYREFVRCDDCYYQSSDSEARCELNPPVLLYVENGIEVWNQPKTISIEGCHRGHKG